MDELVARIKARIANPLLAVDAATWVCPMPTIAPPASAADVDAAEVALGFAIPRLLRRLYTEVGNGGFGPGYGLEGVPTCVSVPGSADIIVLYEMYCCEPPPEYPAHVWPRGLVPLISGGCLSIECVDFLNPPNAVVKYDGGNCKLEFPVSDSLEPVAPSLEARLQAWLAKPAA